MAKQARMLSVLALLMVAAAVVLVVVAEDAGGGGGGGGAWKDNVKQKAGSAADGAKSWKDWAVSKWKGKGDEKGESAAPTTTTEKSGETNEEVMRMTSETQDKASEGAKMAQQNVKAGYETVKEKAASEL